MKTYESKDELKAEIQKSLDRYLAEFDAIPESCKDTRVPDADRTPAENLAYQVGWTALLLQWEADEQHGRAAKRPTNCSGGTNWAICMRGSPPPTRPCP